MRYKHRMIDAAELLKLMDKEAANSHNNYLDKNTINWARNCVCQTQTEENETKLICEFKYGVPIYSCEHCGSPIRSILDKYCSNCGYKIEDSKKQKSEEQKLGSIKENETYIEAVDEKIAFKNGITKTVTVGMCNHCHHLYLYDFQDDNEIYILPVYSLSQNFPRCPCCGYKNKTIPSWNGLQTVEVK